MTSAAASGDGHPAGGPRSLLGPPSRIAALLALLVLPVSLAAARAEAAVVEVTEESLIRQGVEARRRHDDAGALELFRKAYGLHRSPRAAAQMALAEIALGRWEEADQHLTEALTAKDDPWIRKNDGVLRESWQRVRQEFGTLQVLGGPAGAEVVVEGRVRGTVPMAEPIRVRTGECRFEVRAPGHVAVLRTVVVGANAPRRETLVLSPVASAAAPVSSSSSSSSALAVSAGAEGGAPAASGTPAPSSALSPPDSGVGVVGEGDDDARSSRLRTVGFVLGGVGVAAVAAGVVLGLQARSAGERNSRVGEMFDADAEARGKRLQTLQYVGYGLGAALIGAGLVAYVVGGPSKPDGHTRARATLWPASDGRGAFAVLTGGF